MSDVEFQIIEAAATYRKAVLRWRRLDNETSPEALDGLTAEKRGRKIDAANAADEAMCDAEQALLRATGKLARFSRKKASR